MAKFKKGDRVRLPSFEGVVEERGVVEQVEDQERYPGMFIVRVDLQLDRSDDRLREVHEDGMEPE